MTVNFINIQSEVDAFFDPAALTAKDLESFRDRLARMAEGVSRGLTDPALDAATRQTMIGYLTLCYGLADSAAAALERKTADAKAAERAGFDSGAAKS